jgi:hypothetical protein
MTRVAGEPLSWRGVPIERVDVEGHPAEAIQARTRRINAILQES